MHIDKFNDTQTSALPKSEEFNGSTGCTKDALALPVHVRLRLHMRHIRVHTDRDVHGGSDIHLPTDTGTGRGK